jgi:hypothetical protein
MLLPRIPASSIIPLPRFLLGINIVVSSPEFGEKTKLLEGDSPSSFDLEILARYCAFRASVPLVLVPVAPLLGALNAPISGRPGRVAGVAYVMLTVQVPPAASGVVKEQVVPAIL